MKLAVKKEPGIIPGSGFHYTMYPIEMGDSNEAAIWKAMGYIIISVSNERGEKLLESARKALAHQVEIAFLADTEERQNESST